MTQNTTGALPAFDGRDVITSSISIRNAGDGLSEALEFDPTAFHIGQKVFVVLECEVTAVDHRPVPKAEQVLSRKHVLTTEVATIVEPNLVAEVIEQQKAAISAHQLEQKRQKEAEAGVQRVPGTEPWATGDDDGDLPADGFGDGDEPADEAELAPPADPDDAAWEAGAK